MRGIPSLITEIRKKVFTEVARMAYSGDYTDMEDIPFKIVPGQSPLHRESVFLERAIAGERVRLAMGLSLQPVQTRTLLTEGMDQAAIAEQYYEPPLVNIIPYACHACPTRQYRVNELCQGCLASSCQRVCPKGAIKFVNGKSRIDQKLCIKCGKCARSCPYNAITYLERPCQAACGMDAIGVDEYGKACIDYDRCVSCGQCLVSCPFGAIVDKSQIYQVIRSMLEGNEVVAIVAPSFVGQFGKDVTVPKFLTAMKQLGFADVVEVAVGADICTIEEARDFMEKVPEEQRFMATSCCPSWRMMARRLFPAESGNISMTYTPMVYTARLVKRERPDCKVVFVGPCAAKKLEAMQDDIRTDVDFVLTYEELMGIFEARDIDFSQLPDSPDLDEGTRAGRGFAVAGGVAAAVEELIHKEHPECQIKTQRADGLRECRKLLMLAKAGKLDGYLLEGMACPGGCVAGAGTVVSADTAAKKLSQHMAQATGSAADIPIEAPACALSLDEDNTTRPYAIVSLTAAKPGYRTVRIEGIQIFAGQVTLAQLQMLPVTEEDRDIPDAPIVIPPHALFAGSGGGPQPVQHCTPRVLDQVVIPKNITVHLGKPAAAARNVTVSFRDYIANVASSEVYPTWADENTPTGRQGVFRLRTPIRS